MKTVESVTQEINDTLKSITKDSGKAEVDAVKRDVAFLRQCKRYLESSPRKEFIEAQKAEIERRIELIPTHYEAWKFGKVLTKYNDPYKAYQTEMNYSGLKTQLKTLDYLLS